HWLATAHPRAAGADRGPHGQCLALLVAHSPWPNAQYRAVGATAAAAAALHHAGPPNPYKSGPWVYTAPQRCHRLVQSASFGLTNVRFRRRAKTLCINAE